MLPARPAATRPAATRSPSSPLHAAGLIALLAVALLLAACQRAPAAGDKPLAPVLTGIGDSGFTITTRVPAAQQFFRQGLLLAYGFDHAEARRAFAEAARLDPACALCAWGLAYVTGPNINRPERDRLDEARGYAQRALALAAKATPREQALVRAQALRLGVAVPPLPAADVPPGAMCATPAPPEAHPADVAYAEALARIAFDFADDADLGVLHAEALLMLLPWDWWRADGQPNGGTRAAIVELQRVIARHPRHIGALHFLIHAVEQSPTPETALRAAAALPALAPDVGHLVHMPAHIYQRLGRYADASRANLAATAADARLAAQLQAQGFAPQTHSAHHWHFLWASAGLEGRGAAAIDAAERVAALAGQHDESFGGGNDYFIALPAFARLRFARWDEILAGEPAPGASRYPQAVHHLARGVALARRGDAAAAERELAQLDAAAADASLDGRSLKGVDELRELLAIGSALLRGELHVARRQWPQALAAFAQAVALEDALESEEPPPWAYSTRIALASAQLLAGRARAAERTFRADLERHPANGWALYGLAASLRQQGRRSDAAAARQAFEAAWAGADLPRPDTRY